MSYELQRAGDYPGTGLPVFKVYDADDHHSPAIGEVWAVGVPGVTGSFVPTGVRWQLAGSWDVSPVYPVAAYGEAARAMIAAYEGGAA